MVMDLILEYWRTCTMELRWNEWVETGRCLVCKNKNNQPPYKGRPEVAGHESGWHNIILPCKQTLLIPAIIGICFSSVHLAFRLHRHCRL